MLKENCCENDVLKTIISKVGLHRGKPRIWIEGKKLSNAGFDVGSFYEIDIQSKKKLTIKPSDNGGYKVSKKKGLCPVMDISKLKASEVFNSDEKVQIKIFNKRIEITQAPHDRYNEVVKNSFDDSFKAIEFFSGGGTLSKAISDGGFDIKVAVELDSSYAESYENNFPECRMINSAIQDIAMKTLPKGVELLTAGVPCDTYSVARRNGGKGNTGKKTIGKHRNNHMVYYVCEAIRYARPKTVLIEEVKAFSDTVQADMLKSVLSDLNYHVHETVVAPENEITKRQRYCLVASLFEGFTFPKFDYSIEETVKSIFFSGKPERDWFASDSRTIQRELAYLEKHRKKGNGFGFVPIGIDSERVPTLTKDYTKLRSEWYLTDGERYRPCGAQEAKKLHGFPEDFVLPESQTKAMQILGQGVLYRPFKLISESIKNHLQEYVRKTKAVA